jgi:hypothetical protein
MKKTLSLFILNLIIQQSITAQCSSGSYTVTGNAMITGGCTITGDLTIPNGTTLNVDLTGAGADTFVVRGNILVEGNGVLWIHSSPGATNDQFIVSNDFNLHRTITTLDSGRIQLENIEFRTQEGNLTGAASIYMNYDAEDNSILYVDRCWLDGSTAWLLFNMKDKATFMCYNSVAVPTETYIADSAQVSLNGPDTDLGLWVYLESITGTLNLPADQTQPYTWSVGRGAGGMPSGWFLELNNAKAGIGVQIFPSSNVTINGTGLPLTGELKVALVYANCIDTLKNLDVGLQNTVVSVGQGSATLNNVNLGPIAWQVYAMMNANVHIKNSIINEIGIGGPSHITVDSSLLQLAALMTVGAGSSLTLNNSEIWNQTISAGNNSSIVLNNCKVTGSLFNTMDSQSEITVNGGCFFANTAGCDYSTMVNIATGQPNCNPFIPAGFPQNQSPSTVTFNNVNNNCVTGINETEYIGEVAIFPNPANDLVNVKLLYPDQNYIIEVYSVYGQLLLQTSSQTVIDISGFTNGIYLFNIKQANKTWANKVLKQ